LKNRSLELLYPEMKYLYFRRRNKCNEFDPEQDAFISFKGYDHNAHLRFVKFKRIKGEELVLEGVRSREE